MLVQSICITLETALPSPLLPLLLLLLRTIPALPISLLLHQLLLLRLVRIRRIRRRARKIHRLLLLRWSTITLLRLTHGRGRLIAIVGRALRLQTRSLLLLLLVRVIDRCLILRKHSLGIYLLLLLIHGLLLLEDLSVLLRGLLLRLHLRLILGLCIACSFGLELLLLPSADGIVDQHAATVIGLHGGFFTLASADSADEAGIFYLLLLLLLGVGHVKEWRSGGAGDMHLLSSGQAAGLRLQETARLC